MLAIDIESGLSEAWERIATFIPKLLGFLAVLVIGYFVNSLSRGREGPWSQPWEGWGSLASSVLIVVVLAILFLVRR
jgi:hypothetical protein